LVKITERIKYFRPHLLIKILEQCSINQRWITWRKVKWAISTHNRPDQSITLIIKAFIHNSNCLRQTQLESNLLDTEKLQMIIKLKAQEHNWIPIEWIKELIWQLPRTNWILIENSHLRPISQIIIQQT